MDDTLSLCPSSCTTGYISDEVSVQKAGAGGGDVVVVGLSLEAEQHRSRVFDVTAADCKNEG